MTELPSNRCPECGWPEDDGRGETCLNEWHDWELRDNLGALLAAPAQADGPVGEAVTRWEVVRQVLVRMRDDRKADPGEIREYMANQGLDALESLEREHETLVRSHECCWHDGHGHGALGPCAETERQEKAADGP